MIIPRDNEDIPFIVNVDDDTTINVGEVMKRLFDKSAFNYPDTSQGRMTMMVEKMYDKSFTYHTLTEMLKWAVTKDGIWYSMCWNNPTWDSDDSSLNRNGTTLFHDEFNFMVKEGLIRYNTVEIKTLRQIYNAVI
jgi:hypothetical protein